MIDCKKYRRKKLPTGIWRYGFLGLIAFFSLFGFMLFANIIQNDRTGSYELDFFQTTIGIHIENVFQNTSQGTISLPESSTTGYFVFQVLPQSIDYWNVLKITANRNNTNQVTTSIYSCSGTQGYPDPDQLPLLGFENIPYPPNGEIDLSAIDSSEYTGCLQFKVTLAEINANRPTISKVQVTRTPKPVFILNFQSSDTIVPAAAKQIEVGYSLSYADDDNLVIYLPMPSTGNGGITGYTSEYNQDLSVGFLSATNSGKYTSTQITVGDTIIPADSIYWDVGTLQTPKNGSLLTNIRILKGIESGVVYSFQAHSSGANSSAFVTNTRNVQVISSPSPSLLITSNATNFKTPPQYDYKKFITSGALSLPVIFYVQASNSLAATETIFNPTTSVDLSGLISDLATYCSGDAYVRLTGYTGILSGTSLVWTGQHIVPGNVNTDTFIVDFNHCNEHIFSMTGSVVADNVSAVEYAQTLETMINVESKTTFSKIFGGNYYYNSTFSFTLGAQNIGFLAVGDVILFDKVDGALEIRSVQIPAGVNAKVFYHTGNIGDDVSVPPEFNYTGALVEDFGTGRTTTIPTASDNPTWIAVYLECLASSSFPTSGGANKCYNKVSSINIPVTVKAKIPISNQCSSKTVNNTMHYREYSAATDPVNTDDFFAPLNPYLSGSANNGQVLLMPMRGAWVTNFVSGPSVAHVGETATYTVSAINNGVAAAQSVVLTVLKPATLVNGVLQNLSLSEVQSQRHVTYLTDRILVDLGSINVGQTKAITISFIIPSGVNQQGTYTVASTLHGEDGSCGIIELASSKTTSVDGDKAIDIIHSRDLQYILRTGYITYTTEAINTGEIALPDAYTISEIPSTTEFVEAYLTGSHGNETYNCTKCEVYFAQTNANIPQELNNNDPFEVTDIMTYFAPGISAGNGIWISPWGTGTRYMAVKLRDNNNVFASSATMHIGFKVQDIDTPIGYPIANHGAILTNIFPQTISNSVSSYVSTFPGLVIETNPISRYMPAGYDFVYYVGYYNDSESEDANLSLTIDVPLGFTIIDITHAWNPISVGGGQVSGWVDITHNSAITIDRDQVVLDAVALAAGDISAREGGILAIHMRTYSGAANNIIYDLPVLGTYGNEVGSSQLALSDWIQIKNPDLFITKTVSPSDPAQGEEVTYTVTVQNKGYFLASGVQIRDTLQSGLCFVTGSVQTATLGRALGQPTLLGDCHGTGQTLLRNHIKNTSLITGNISAESEAITFTYKGIVADEVTAGTEMANAITISNTLTEDPNIWTNTGSATIKVPYPDLEVHLTVPVVVQPGDPFSFTLDYSNISKAYAQDPYIILKLPDTINTGKSDITLDSVTPNQSQNIYYHTGSGLGTRPVFDTDNPLQNGRSVTATTDTNFVVIQHTATLSGNSPDYSVTFFASAIDPLTHNRVTAGTQLLFQVSGVVSDLMEEDYTNNFASGIVRTPGTDLAIQIAGDPQGVMPGGLVGDNIDYTVTYGNIGHEQICQVYIDIYLGSGISLRPGDITHNFLYINMNDIEVVDASGHPVTGLVPVTNGLLDNRIRFVLGGSNGSGNVCIPSNASSSFQIYTVSASDLLNASYINTHAQIQHSSSAIEDYTGNNIDEADVTLYKADLTLTKIGIPRGIGGIQNDTLVRSGEIIDYKLSYGNIGGYAAQDIKITDHLAPGNCLEIGSIFSNPFSTFTLQYSNDNGSNWGYHPVGTTGNIDCDVHAIRISMATGMVPSNMTGEGPTNFDGYGMGLAFLSGLGLAQGLDIGNPPGFGGYYGGAVYKIAIQDDGKIIVGGGFDTYQGFESYDLIRLNPDGSRDTSFNAGDGFTSNYQNPINTIAIQNDGKIIVGGNFTSYQGTGARYIIRLNSDGSRDTGFNVGTGIRDGFNGFVDDIVIQEDQKIVVGGMFNTYKGVTANYIVRLDTNGNRDSSFYSGAGFNARSYSPTHLALQGDGKIIAVGGFMLRNGSVINHVIRLTTSGTRDTTFNTSGWDYFSSLEAIDIQDDGKILIGGYFSGYAGLSANHIVRLNSDGSRDTSFDVGSGFNGAVGTVLVDADGKIIVGGYFTGYQGVLANHIIRLNSDGSRDLDFGSGGFDDWVLSLAMQDDQKIVVGGTFHTYTNREGQTSLVNNIIGLNEIGNVDTGFDIGHGPGGSVSNIINQNDHEIMYLGYGSYGIHFIGRFDENGTRDFTLDVVDFNQMIYDTKRQIDGKFIVGGGFTIYQGVSANYIIRLNADGSRDTSFDVGSGFDKYVTTLSLQDDGKIIVGGDFTGYQGVSSNYIIRLNADGSRDTSFEVGSGFDNGVDTLSIQDDGKIIVGGNFTNYQGSGVSHIIRLNSDGSRDTGFNVSNSEGYGAGITNLILQDDGKIIFGGVFLHDQGIYAGDVFRLNSDGSRDTSFNVGSGFNNMIETLAIQDNGKIVVGGSFTNYQGFVANRIIRLNSDGSRDTSFNVGSGFNLTVNGLAVQSNGQIIVGGDFTGYKGSPAYYLTVLDPRGNQIPFGGYLIGTYTHILSTETGFVGWDTLFVNDDISTDTAITYTIYTVTGGVCDTGNVLIGPETVLSGILDISTISSAHTQICIGAILTTQNTGTTPKLMSYAASYFSNTLPYIQYTTQVVGHELNSFSLPNTANILTFTPEIDYTNNEASYLVNVQQADLEVNKVVNRLSAFTGEEIIYTITYINHGPYTAYNGVLTDYSSASLTGLSFSRDPISDISGTIQWDLGNIPVGSGGSITITGRIIDTAVIHTDIINTVMISNDNIDPNFSNNSDTVYTKIGTIANLSMQINCDAIGYAGTSTLCHITHGNNGNTGTVDSTLSIGVSSGYTIHTISDVRCHTGSQQNVLCDFGAYEYGTTGVFDITVSIPPTTLGGSTMIVSGSIATTSPESTMNDNYDDDSIFIHAPGDSKIQGYVYVEKNSNTGYDAGTDIYVSGARVLRAGKDMYGNIYAPNKTLYPEAYNIFSGYITELQNPSTEYITGSTATTNNGGYFIIQNLSSGTYYLYIVGYTGWDNLYSVGGSGNIGRSIGSLQSGIISSQEIITIDLGLADFHQLNNFAIDTCGDGATQRGEECDDGNSNNDDGCSNTCQGRLPTCGISVSPTTGHSPLTGNLVLSGIDTSWMRFDWLEFGDGNGVDIYGTGPTNYSHAYASAGIYTGKLQVSNIYGSSLKTQCTAAITVTPYCGNGVTESGEQCDGQNYCTNCIYKTPTCHLSISPLTGTIASGGIPITATYTISGVDTGRMYVNYLSFGDEEYIEEPNTFTYTHDYTQIGTYTGILSVYSIYTREEARCTATISISPYCGDGAREGTEQCDDNNTDSGDGCSNRCQLETPTCSLSVDPLTGSIPLTGIYTISNITTGWMRFDWLEFGDGSTGNVDTGTLLYNKQYATGGMYTGVLQVSNIYSGSVKAQCTATITANSVCGNGLTGWGEQCDDGNLLTGDGCNDSCQLEIPTCELLVDPLTGYVGESVSYTITGYNTGWTLLSWGRGYTEGFYEYDLSFEDNSLVYLYDYYNDSVYEFSFPPGDPVTYSYTYGQTGIHTSTISVYNNQDPNLQAHSECSININILQRPYCGDGVTQTPNNSGFNEQCDDGNNLSGDGCFGCLIESNYCSGVTLDVYPSTAYSGSTIVTYMGSFTGRYTSGYTFISLNYGFGLSRDTNSSTGATFTTGIVYHSGGTVSGSVVVQNIYSGAFTGLCNFNTINIYTCNPLGYERVPVGFAGFSSGTTSYTSLAIDNGVPYIAYVDGGSSNKATVKKFSGSNRVTVGSLGFSSGTASYISLAIDNGVPYIAYYDGGNGNKATVKKLSGSNWVTVGSLGFSSGSALYISLVIDNGVPYIAYYDGGNGNKATVKQFSGSNWITLGSLGFSSGSAQYISLAIDNGVPYVAYTDGGNSSKTTVKQFSGSNWITVGSLGFSSGTATYTSLAIDNGVPYVAYTDGGNSSKATVKKFSGSNWVTVGSLGFSSGTATYTSLAIDNGVPYIAYRDGGNSSKTTIMKFSGSNWITVGVPGFSRGTASYTSLALYSGTSYVAYVDAGNGSKATVMKVTSVAACTFCGDGITQTPNNSGLNEQCDDGNMLTGDGCNECMAETPSCTLTVTPLTGQTPLNGTFTISNINTGRMNFDFLDYGDETTGNVNTGTLTYLKQYSVVRTYTGILQVSNIYDASLTGQCSTSLSVLSGAEAICGNGIRESGEQCDPNDSSQSGRGNRGCTANCTPSNGGGGGGSTNYCALPSLRPCANVSGIDYSPSTSDNTCCPTTTLTGRHGSPSLIGIGCKYTDEKYQDNGSFPDTLTSRAFQYIELLRINCIHRGIWNKVKYPYPSHTIPRLYSPERPITRAEMMKTYVKLWGIFKGDLNITREEYPYPGKTPFADVPKTHWASWYADTAYTKGLVDGLYTKQKGKLYLSPDKQVTRQELVFVMMKTYRLIHPKTIDATFKTKFVDIKKSDPYYTYIVAAEQLGFIQGRTDTKGRRYFDGKKNITKAQFAKLVALPFQAQLYIDIDATILNSAIYKEIVSAIHKSKSNRLVFINALLARMTGLDEQYILATFKVDKQKFLEALAVLLLDNEVDK